MASWDFRNYTGWRHQHSGYRHSWEDALNGTLPGWRKILTEKPQTWYVNRQKFLVNATRNFNLRTDGLKVTRMTTYTAEDKKNKRRKLSKNEETDIEADGGLETSQWAFTGNIGGDLFTLLDTDGVWEKNHTFIFVADNETMVNIICGRANPDIEYRETTAEILDTIAKVMTEANWGPKSFYGDPIVWRKREFNKEADFLANYAMDNRKDFHYINEELINQRKSIINVQGWSDGGCGVEERISSFGWILKGWTCSGKFGIIAAGARFFDRPSTSSLEIRYERDLAPLLCATEGFTDGYTE